MGLKKLIVVISLLGLMVIVGCNKQPTPTNPAPTPAPQAPQQSAQTPSTTPPTTTPPATTQAGGADLYNTNCSGCHGANGTGGSAPALNTDEWKNNSSKVQDITKKGKGSMPGFASSLNDTQIKAIGDYVASFKK